MGTYEIISSVCTVVTTLIALITSVIDIHDQRK